MLLTKTKDGYRGNLTIVMSIGVKELSKSLAYLVYYDDSLGFVEDNKILLLKPQTYMNRSGEAVSSASDFYKIPLENIIVIHDEMDVSLGRILIKPGGGSAGNNGIKSIISYLGSKEFIRVRIGIGKPGAKSDGSSHVLSSFSKSESSMVEDSIVTAADAVLEIIQNGFQSAMNKYNSKSKNQENIDQINSH